MRDRNYLFIHQNPPSLGKIIIASILLSISIFCLLRFIWEMFYSVPRLLDFFFFTMLLCFGFSFAVATNFHLDLEKNRFKEEYQLGIIKIGWWEPMFPWEYVSIFEIEEDIYVIRLWMEGNDYFTVAGYSDLNVALKQGLYIGEILKLNVLDAATDPRDSEWISIVK